jgi:hypothetical protein
MSFTDHLRRLDASRAPDEAFLADLGRALRRRLRKAELWDHSPALLGYPEFRTWGEAFADGPAVAAPTIDCFLEAVVRRYDALMDQLLTQDNIDGLVFLNIDRFILARRRNHDPIGYSAFKNLEAALEEMAAADEVTAEQRTGGRLRNATVIRWAAAAALATRETLEAALAADPEWEQALPRMVKIGRGAQRLLLSCLRHLPRSGVLAFLLGDLAGLLKERARQAHAARNRLPDDEVVLEGRAGKDIAELIRIVRPAPGYEQDREAFQLLVRRLQQAIEGLGLQERTRTGLSLLLKELSHYAETDEDAPSWAELARRLGVRRATLWDHLERLREVARRLHPKP